MIYTGTMVFNEASSANQLMLSPSVTLKRFKTNAIWIDGTNITQVTTAKIFVKLGVTGETWCEEENYRTTINPGKTINILRGNASPLEIDTGLEIRLSCGGGGIGNVNVYYRVTIDVPWVKNIYVASWGDDLNDGQEPANAYLNIETALTNFCEQINLLTMVSPIQTFSFAYRSIISNTRGGLNIASAKHIWANTAKLKGLYITGAGELGLQQNTDVVECIIDCSIINTNANNLPWRYGMMKDTLIIGNLTIKSTCLKLFLKNVTIRGNLTIEAGANGCAENVHVVGGGVLTNNSSDFVFRNYERSPVVYIDVDGYGGPATDGTLERPYKTIAEALAGTRDGSIFKILSRAGIYDININAYGRAIVKETGTAFWVAYSHLPLLCCETFVLKNIIFHNTSPGGRGLAITTNVSVENCVFRDTTNHNQSLCLLSESRYIFIKNCEIDSLYFETDNIMSDSLWENLYIKKVTGKLRGVKWFIKNTYFGDNITIHANSSGLALQKVIINGNLTIEAGATGAAIGLFVTGTITNNSADFYIQGGGGSGVNAQEIRDAMKLAPSAGDPATQSIDDYLNYIKRKVARNGVMIENIDADVANVDSDLKLTKQSILDETSKLEKSFLNLRNYVENSTGQRGIIPLKY